MLQDLLLDHNVKLATFARAPLQKRNVTVVRIVLRAHPVSLFVLRGIGVMEGGINTLVKKELSVLKVPLNLLIVQSLGHIVRRNLKLRYYAQKVFSALHPKQNIHVVR